MKFSFVFSLIFKNRTYIPNTSILTENVFLVTLKVKYQNVHTVCSFSPVTKYLLIPRAWKISMTWKMWHFFTLFGSFWYLAIKVTNKKWFVQIEICGKSVGFWNISKNTKENTKENLSSPRNKQILLDRTKRTYCSWHLLQVLQRLGIKWV